METVSKDEIGIPIELEKINTYLSRYFYGYTHPAITQIGNIIFGVVTLNAFSPMNCFCLLKPGEIKKLDCAIAVYIIFDSLHRLVYIGSSTDINKRLTGHEKIKPSDSWVIAIPLDHIQGAKNWKANLKLIEKALICSIRPERNELGYIAGRNRR